MTRSTFLSVAASVALLVGGLALLAPAILLAELKHAEVTPAAMVMARTVGVLLLCVGALALLVRRHPDSRTMRAVLLANLLVQLGLLPIDPLAWYGGAFHTLGSFVPNTLIHLGLAAGFAFYWRRCADA